MKLKAGDWVIVIDEALEGEVIQQEEDWVVFKCNDGFEYRYPLSSVMHRGEDGENQYFERTSFKLELESESDSKLTTRKISLKGKKPEFDLHMESLLPEGRLPKSIPALVFQLDYSRKVIQKATEARCRSVVFIHGKGSGTLREALRTMLDEEFPNIEYFDANYQRFGPGATEIYIHGLGKAGKP